MSELPKGWGKISLNKFTFINMGQSPKSEFVNDSGNGVPFYQGKTEFGKIYPIPRKYCTKPTKLAEKGDVLLSIRAPVGPTNLCPEQSCIGRGLASIRSVEPLSQQYLLHYFRYLEPWLGQQGTGTTFKSITGTFLRGIEVLVAPLNEQIRIGNKLDLMLAKVETAQVRLDKIPNILKRFRQSVLAAATSGELTKEWRDENQVTFNWDEIKVSDIVSKIEAGKSIKCDERPPREGEFGIIKISAVTWGKYNEEESKTLKDKSIFLENRRVQVGDFLISRANTLELLGMPVIVHAVTKNLMLSDKVLRLVMNETDKQWLNYYFRSPMGRTKIENSSSGNQDSMRNIGQKSLLNITLNNPQPDEKIELIRRVESLFTMADIVDKQYQAIRKNTDRLTLSILAKAFRGELVPQDSTDEPASKLLEKIKLKQLKVNPIKIKKKASAKPKKTVAIPKVESEKVFIRNEPGSFVTVALSEGRISRRDWLGGNAVYAERAIQSLKGTTFTIEQFQSVTSFPKPYEELKNLILNLVKGIPGINEPLFEIVDWDKKTGEYNFKLKDVK